MNKKSILSDLFFSMPCESINSFCKMHGINRGFWFGVFDFDLNYLSEILEHIHNSGEDVHLSLYGGLCDSYMFCHFVENDGYYIDFLPDESEAFENAFDFENVIIPLLDDKETLNWVIERSGREMSMAEKKLLFGRNLKVTIEYNILNSCVSTEDEVECIREILGVDMQIKEDIIDNVRIMVGEV